MIKASGSPSLRRLRVVESPCVRGAMDGESADGIIPKGASDAWHYPTGPSL